MVDTPPHLERQETGVPADQQADSFHQELMGALRDQAGAARENFKPPRIESDEERVELRRLAQLQTLVLQNLELLIPDKATRDNFKQRLAAEMGQQDPLSDGEEYLKKPQYDQATREGFQLIVKLYEKVLVPAKAQELAGNNLSAPPGLDVNIIGATPGAFKSGEQFRQELMQGKADLGITVPETNSRSVGPEFVKLRHIDEWLNLADAGISNKRGDMLTDFYAAKLEKGIREGKYPESWRRPETMDKATWCGAFENAVATYDQATRVVVALNQLQRSNKGFSTDAFEHLPAGMVVTRDQSGGIKVDFGPLMISSLGAETADNKPKLAALQQWTDNYMATATQVAAEISKDMTKLASFGEIEIGNGQVDARTGKFTAGGAPLEGMQPFNLMTFDVDVKPSYDAYGAVKGYEVQTHTAFEQVPPYGYLNTMGKEVARVDGQTTNYLPNEFVAVQTGGGRVQLIQAKDLADWKTEQEIKHYGAKGITLTMDVAMLASGGVEFVAAREALARGALEVGGKILAKEAAENIPRELLQKQMAKGAFEIALGGTGVFRNAGGDENPALQKLTTARSVYFLLQAGGAVFSMTGLPKLAGLGQDAHAARAAEAARASSVESLGAGWKGVEGAATKAFSYSDKAFLVQFLDEQRQAIALRRRHENSAALDLAVDATFKALSGDRRSIERLYQEDPLRGPLLKDHLDQYKKSLGNINEDDSKKIDDLTKKACELTDPNLAADKKQQYMNELVKYFRYDGQQISAKQNNNEPISEEKLSVDAACDPGVASPAVREMAALTLALIGRAPDGKWPANLATRVETVQYNSVIGYDSESGTPITESIGPKQVEQSITTEGILRLLMPQVTDTANGGVRPERAAALRDAGLISSEHYGSILAANIRRTDVPIEKRIDSIAQLVATVNRLRTEEEFRDKLPNEQRQMLRGMAAGASSTDLQRQLKAIGDSAQDPAVRATAQFASDFLAKNSLDKTDVDRFREVFSEKGQPGIKPEMLTEWRHDDLESKPSTSAAEERRIQAAESKFLDAQKTRDAVGSTSAFNTLMDSFRSPDPSLADRALGIVMSNRARLCGADYEKFRRELLGLVAGRLETDQSPDARIDAVKLRVNAIHAGQELFAQEKLINQRYFMGVLCDSLNGPTAVKVEALKTLSSVAAPGNAEVIDAIKPLLTSEKEPSEAVRLQAIKTLELLVPTSAEKRALFGPLTTTEPNSAAREALEKYHRPAGSASDKDSEVTKEAVDRIRTKQNNPNSNEATLQAALEADPDLRLLRKTNQQNIWDIIDNSRALTMRYLDQPPGIRSIDAWNVAKQNRNWKDCVAFEMDAQNAGIQQYLERVDRLAARGSQGDAHQREQAVLQMSMLISKGEGVSPVYYQHKANTDGTTFTPEQIKRIWNDNANYIWGKTGKFPGTPQDPWPQAELRMANELKKLCISHEGKVRDDVLMSAVLANLTVTTTDRNGVAGHTGSAASDETRLAMLQGVDALLSRPGGSDESKRNALIAVGQSLKDMKADMYPKAAADMIRLLDKYGPKVFDQYSPEWSGIRDAIKSQAGTRPGDAENLHTPPMVKAAAERTFDKQWGSVIEIFNRLPVTENRQTTRELADLLPQNLIGLEKTQSQKSGHEEQVRNAVEQIFQATKGHPLQANDPRYDKLASLRDPKYDDAVRLAAAAVLGDGTTLVDIAANADDKALRTDATKLLASMNTSTGASPADTAQQEHILRRTVSDVLHADITGDAMQQAIDYLTQADPKDAKAEIIRQQLHWYGDACASVATAMSHDSKADKDSLLAASALFARSLQAHGVNKDAFAKLPKEDKDNFSSSRLQFTAIDEADRMLREHQDSGDIEQVRMALLEYARIQPRIGGSRTEAMQSTQLADKLGSRMFAPYSDEAYEGDSQVLSTLRQLAGLNGTRRDASGTRLMGAAYGRAADALLQLESEKRWNPPGDAKLLDAQIVQAKTRAAYAGVDALVYDASFLAQSNSDVRNDKANKEFFDSLTRRVEAQINKLDPAEKFDSANLKFHVSYARAIYLQGEERKVALKQMQNLLPDALRLAEEQFGKDSRQYKNLVAHSTVR